MPAGLGKWSGGVYLPTLNRIVGCPHSSTDVLVIEPEDGVTSTGDEFKLERAVNMNFANMLQMATACC